MSLLRKVVTGMKSKLYSRPMPPNTQRSPIRRPLPSDLGDDRILDAHQAAALTGVSVSTWRRQYWAGKTPRALHVGERRIGWRVRDLKNYLAERGGDLS